jgi:glutaredoxin
MRVYTGQGCEYCKKLKELLAKENIDYVEIDVDDKENKEEADKVFEFAGVAVVPIIIKKPHMLVPTKSFNTIEEAINLIKSLD